MNKETPSYCNLATRETHREKRADTHLLHVVHVYTDRHTYHRATRAHTHTYNKRVLVRWQICTHARTFIRKCTRMRIRRTVLSQLSTARKMWCFCFFFSSFLSSSSLFFPLLWQIHFGKFTLASSLWQINN